MIFSRAVGIFFISLLLIVNRTFSEEAVLGFGGKHASYFGIPVKTSEYRGNSIGIAFDFHNTIHLSYRSDFYGLMLAGEFDFKYPAPDPSDYEFSIFPRQVYFYLRSDKIYFSLGNQLINWGLGNALGDTINPKKYWNGLLEVQQKEVWAVYWEFFITHAFNMKLVYLPIGSSMTDQGEDVEIMIEKNFSQEITVSGIDEKINLKNFEIGLLFDFRLSAVDMAWFYLYHRDHDFTAEITGNLSNQLYVPDDIGLYRAEVHSIGFYGVKPFSFYNLWWELVLRLSDNGFAYHAQKRYPAFSWSSGWEFFLGSRQETILSLTHGGTWRINYKTPSSVSGKTYYDRLANDLIGANHEELYQFIQVKIENETYFYRFYRLISKLHLYYGWPLFYDDSTGKRLGDILLIPEFEFQFDDHFSIGLGLQYFYSLAQKDGKITEDEWGKFNVFENNSGVFIKFKYSWEVLNLPDGNT